MSLRIGILAEDETDCDALAMLVRRIAAEVSPLNVGVNKHWLKGCSRLRKKARSKLAAIAEDGCVAAIVVHDLDRNPANNMLNDEPTLRSALEDIEVPGGLRRIVCIPVEELEAWFWADPEVIAYVGQGQGKAAACPHLIQQPKERLIALSRGANQRPRYTTNDNESLAKKLNMTLCAARCPSFRLMRDFVVQVSTAASG
jgi:hypothetical protein